MLNCENLEMNINLLPTMYLKFISEYMKRYNLPAFKALEETAISVYKFTEAHQHTTASMQNYKERLFKLISDNVFELSDLEKETIFFYFRGYSITGNENYSSLETQLKADIKKQNAYNQKLFDDTAKQRHLIENSLFMLTDELYRYIEYWKVFKGNADLLLYNNLYFLGYIAGKRAERARRKHARR